MEYKKALSKCMQMCSRKEYCITDIKQKLYSWELNEEDIERLIATLQEEKFIDEERFVNAFVNDKFKFNHWGKVKIRYHLKHKQIDENVVNNVLSGLSDAAYEEVIAQEIAKKISKVKANSTYERKAKVVNYLASKGFEPDLVFKYLAELE